LVGLGALVAPGYLYLFAALALAMNLGAYFFSDRIVLRMHAASEVSPRQAPELHAMVAELAERAGIPKPRVFVIPEEQPNAFATGRNPKHGVVAVTEGIVRLLDRRELRGVIAHELGHIKNRDILSLRESEAPPRRRLAV
jgi:heat shock protein HtpX